jgi:hypothetical protein
MNAFKKFYSLGAEDADRRVAAALTSAPLEPGDRYLKASEFVTAIDLATIRLRDWWSASQACRMLLAAREAFRRETPAVRSQAIASVLLGAVVVHVTLTLAQGPRPGWFWLVVPALTALFAVLLLAGTRSSQSTP